MLFSGVGTDIVDPKVVGEEEYDVRALRGCVRDLREACSKQKETRKNLHAGGWR